MSRQRPPTAESSTPSADGPLGERTGRQALAVPRRFGPGSTGPGVRVRYAMSAAEGMLRQAGVKLRPAAGDSRRTATEP